MPNAGSNTFKNCGKQTINDSTRCWPASYKTATDKEWREYAFFRRRYDAVRSRDRVTRDFDAPPDLVFAYHTKCEYVQKWLLGPPGWSMPVCNIDLRVGGRYRYVWRSNENGKEFGVSGEFREISAPGRIVIAETMDGFPGQAHVTTLFEKNGAGTAFSITIQFETKEYRDGALASGMTDGMSMSYDRLDETVATQP